MLISAEQSQSFAALSGDFNPQHLDPVRARRFIFGQTVVHGVHLVMQGLDEALAAAGRKVALVSVQAAFSTPVPTGCSFSIEVTGSSPEKGIIFVKLGDRLAASIDFAWKADDAPAGRPQVRDESFSTEEATEQAIESVNGLAKEYALQADRAVLARLFPHVAACLPVDQVAVLLAATRFVGMDCPGMNSILASLAVDFTAPSNESHPKVNFTVVRARPALGACSIKFDAPGAHGTINALFRPPPAAQPSLRDVQAHVPPKSFAGQRVAIIGGSRGLGELAAKIIAAGGGEVVIGYAQGRDDAARVAAEIAAGGGIASIFHFDVTADGTDELVSLPAGAPSHLYYFATPRIDPGEPGGYDQAKYDRYHEYYVTALARVLTPLLQDRSGPLTLFNPSTIFLDQPDPKFAEYSAAKAASEALCESLCAKFGGRLRLCMPRLPRLKTDQTVVLRGQSEARDALDVLLAVLPRSRSPNDQ